MPVHAVGRGLSSGQADRCSWQIATQLPKEDTAADEETGRFGGCGVAMPPHGLSHKDLKLDSAARSGPLVLVFRVYGAKRQGR